MRSSDSRARGAELFALRGEQQIGEAEDRVERRAQLVAHRREELRLHAVRARERLALLGEDALLAQAIVRPRVVETDGELARGVADELLAIVEGAVVRPRITAPAPSSPTRDRLREHPAELRLADAEVELGRCSPSSRGPSTVGSRVSITLCGRPLLPKSAVSSARPSTDARVHRDEAIGGVEQEDRADLRVREAHEPAKTRRRERAHVERLQLAHELGVRARLCVARGELRVGAREIVERRLAIGERRSQARVLVEEERLHLREAAADGAELVAPVGSAGSGSSRPVAASASSSRPVAPARSRAIQIAAASAMTIATSRSRACRARESLADSNAVDCCSRASLIASLRSSVRIARISSVRTLPARPAPSRPPRRAPSRAICGSLTLSDPVVHEAAERRDALVFHAVLRRRLRLGEDALEIVSRLLVRLRNERSPVRR